MARGELAVVGDSTSVAGWAPLGFATFPVTVSAETRALWPELVGGRFAVVLLTEIAYEDVADLLAERVDEPLPVISVIPGAGGEGGRAGKRLDAAIERALGTKLSGHEGTVDDEG